MSTQEPCAKGEEKLAILVDNLHSSLEINLIVEHFFKLLQARKLSDGIIFKQFELNVSQHMGDIAKHQSSYEIEHFGLKLGHLVVSRKKKYSQSDLKSLDKTVHFLKNPLKNAIMHNKTLYAAMHDPLTSLLNRSSLAETITREISRAERDSRPLALLLVDLDDFKKINDSYGHIIGDKILRQVATTIKLALRETDYAYRIGGEEFLIILPNTNLNGGKVLAERLRRQIEKPLKVEEKLPLITGSIGFASHEKGETVGHFFAKADKALYKAKAEGKNRVIIAH